MERIWKQFGKHLDIVMMAVTSLFIAGVAWANINSTLKEHERALATHTHQIEQVENDSHTIKETSARTEQKVDDMANNITDIKQWLRAKK